MRGLSVLALVVAIACVLSVLGCDTFFGSGNNGYTPPPPGGGFDPTQYAGDWTGQWNNTTFSSQGAASAEVTVDEGAGTVTFNMDMDGNVLGGADPAPVEFTANYDGTGVTFAENGTPFGDVGANVGPGGNITGRLTNVGGGIDTVDFTGTITPTTITINYTVNFSGGGSANGTLVLNKV